MVMGSRELSTTYVRAERIWLQVGGGGLYVGHGHTIKDGGLIYFDSLLDEADGRWPSADAYADLGVDPYKWVPLQLAETLREINGTASDEIQNAGRTAEMEYRRAEAKHDSVGKSLTELDRLDRAVEMVQSIIAERQEAINENLKVLARIPGKDYLGRTVAQVMNEVREGERQGLYDDALQAVLSDEVEGVVASNNIKIHGAVIKELNAILNGLLGSRGAAENTFKVFTTESAGLSVAAGAVAVSSTGGLTLDAAISAAAQTARTVAGGIGSLAGASITVGFGALVYSPSLSNGELPPSILNLPVSALGISLPVDLQSIANTGGSVQIPLRIYGDQESYSIVATSLNGIGSLSPDVPVYAASWDAGNNAYKIIIPGAVPVTLTFPIVDPRNGSTHTPSHSVKPEIYTGVILEPIATFPEGRPVLDQFDVRDGIYVFPSDSGIAPIYVMFHGRRYEPGVASGEGTIVTGVWLSGASTRKGAPIPSQIASKLKGREFSSFDKMREAFWLAVSDDPQLSSQFRSSQMVELSKGRSPLAPLSEQVGNRKRYELHHVNHIADGGEVYDVDNIRVITPKQHIQLHKKQGE